MKEVNHTDPSPSVSAMEEYILDTNAGKSLS